MMPLPTPLLAQFYVEIAASGASADFMANLRGVTVKDFLQPDMYVITLNHGGFKFADDNNLRFGKDIEVGTRSRANESASSTKLFAGQIAGIETDVREHGVALNILRCFNRLHMQRPAASAVRRPAPASQTPELPRHASA